MSWPNDQALPQGGALADQLKRSEYKRLPLPYVWWNDCRRDWWLSTESGSRAVGTFEEAVAALAEVAPNDHADNAGGAHGKECCHDRALSSPHDDCTNPVKWIATHEGKRLDFGWCDEHKPKTFHGTFGAEAL